MKVYPVFIYIKKRLTFHTRLLGGKQDLRRGEVPQTPRRRRRNTQAHTQSNCSNVLLSTLYDLWAIMVSECNRQTLDIGVPRLWLPPRGAADDPELCARSGIRFQRWRPISLGASDGGGGSGLPVATLCGGDGPIMEQLEFWAVCILFCFLKHWAICILVSNYLPQVFCAVLFCILHLKHPLDVQLQFRFENHVIMLLRLLTCLHQCTSSFLLLSDPTPKLVQGAHLCARNQQANGLANVWVLW